VTTTTFVVYRRMLFDSGWSQMRSITVTRKKDEPAAKREALDAAKDLLVDLSAVKVERITREEIKHTEQHPHRPIQAELKL